MRILVAHRNVADYRSTAASGTVILLVIVKSLPQ